MFYPNDEQELRGEIDHLLAAAKQYDLTGTVRGMLCPVAGYAFSGRAAAASFCALQGADYVRRVVLIANTLQPTYQFQGIALPIYDAFRTPLGSLAVDRTLCRHLSESELFQGPPEVHDAEHRIEIQLPFLQTVLGDVAMVPMLVGDVDESAIVQISTLLQDLVREETILVTCSPLSSTYYDSFPKQDLAFRRNPKSFTYTLDEEAVRHIVNLDRRGFRQYRTHRNRSMLRSEAVEISLGTLAGRCFGKLLDHYASSYVSGDSGSTQSYAAIAFVDRAFDGTRSWVSFLCHSSSDKAFVEKLAEDLSSMGMKVWFDKRELRPGDSLNDRIQAGIRQSGYVVVVLSRASVASQWVRRELNASLVRELRLRRVFVVPVLIEDCELPEFLTDKVYADFRTDYGLGLRALISRLQESPPGHADES